MQSSLSLGVMFLAYRELRLLGCASFLAIFFTLAGIAGTPAARAELIDVTWEGTIRDGNDQTGIFGGTRGVKLFLDGYAYVATYRFDTTLGHFNAGDGTYQQLVGGTSYGAGVSGPAVSASITINGGTLSVGNHYWGNYQRRDASASHLITEVLQTNAAIPAMLDQIFNRVIRSDDSLLDTPVLTTPYTRTFVSGDTTDGHSQYSDGTYLMSVNLSPTKVTVSVVPEPSALLPMLVFGALLVARTRRLPRMAA